jgi:opacity protein-like surface antigen
MKASATIFMPSIGLKYFFLESGKLKAYGLANYSKIFLSVKVKDSEDPTINEDVQKEIKNIKISGWQLGFGTEYFFDEHFSVGGEFGLIGLGIKDKTERERTLFDPNTGDDIITKINQNLKLNINPTYARMTLNFYF